MTPREEQLMREEIRARVAEATAALRLELGGEVTRSKSEVGLEQRALEHALAARDKQIIEVLRQHGDTIAEKTTASIAPTARGAERAALRTEWKTEAISVDTDAIAKSQQKALVWWRHPALPIVVYAICDYVSSHVKGWLDALAQ